MAASCSTRSAAFTTDFVWFVAFLRASVSAVHMLIAYAFVSPPTRRLVAVAAYEAANTGLKPLYRFYNWRAGTHFYTASEAEKANVLGHTDWPFTYEGIAFYALN